VKLPSESAWIGSAEMDELEALAKAYGVKRVKGAETAGKIENEKRLKADAKGGDVKPNPCPNALENGGDGFHSAWDCPAECTYQSIGKPKPSPQPKAYIDEPKPADGKDVKP